MSAKVFIFVSIVNRKSRRGGLKKFKTIKRQVKQT